MRNSVLQAVIRILRILSASTPQPRRERLHALIEPRIGDEIEPREHDTVRDVRVLREIVRDAASEDGPIVLTDGPAREAVVSRVDPTVPERERNVQPGELRRRAHRKVMLESVEAATDRVVPR